MPESSTTRRSYWSSEINKAKKRYDGFWSSGDRVIDEYRMQKSDGNDTKSQDKYNILYSSTETIRPNLYSQKPNVRVQLRHKDRANQAARDAVMLLESCLNYIVEEDDLDEVMDSVVEDLLLPGLGNAWVLYEPKFGPVTDDNGDPLLDDKEQPQEELLDEYVKFEYVYWKDFLTGVSRGWRSLPWLAKRCWLTKAAAKKRFGATKANKLTYSSDAGSKQDTDNVEETAEVWEIWDKRSKTVIWYSDSYGGDVIDMLEDPLRLKGFFPCPRPLRAISNTRSFVPRALYSQYKSQAETLNELTKRIRLLTEAIKVVGLFNGSEAKISDILSPTSGNKMIPIESWVSFAQIGGIKGNVEWLPLDAVVAALTQTLQAREICKTEIYEITGFSDIIRGVSKASETLGAQNIKADWAGARVKKMQREVQRFARDLIAIAGEVVSEHCQPVTIAQFGGIDIPDQDQMATNPDAQQIIPRFEAAIAILKQEGRRCAAIDIETDSTLLADEAQEREDRSQFLSAAGAFLQQAVPAMEATPALGPLLGAMLMFVVRTFPSSRPIEEEFEKVQKVLASQQAGQGQQQDQDPTGNKARAQADIQTTQMKVASDDKKAAVDAQSKQADAANEQARVALEATKEANRHEEKMLEIALKEREVAVKERELGIRQTEMLVDQDTEARAAELDEIDQAHRQDLELRQQDQSETNDAAQQQQEYDRMDREDERAEAQRELTPAE